MTYMDINPDLIRERHRQMLREANALRLQKRLREDRESRGSRFFALARMSSMPHVRGAGLTR
jgi:hypothetical protein